MSAADDIFSVSDTNFTKTIHKDVYAAVDPTSTELSQTGKVVLITGGGENLGLCIAQAFVQAAVDTVIILGRRAELLEKAKVQLEQQSRDAKLSTRIIARVCDVTDPAQVKALWKGLNDLKVTVDVFVANAARPPQAKSILESGAEDIWAQMETNVKGALLMAEAFCAQPVKGQKFIVNVSVASLHFYTHPASAARPGGTLSKTSAAMMFQLLAMENKHEDMQVVTYHPGLLWNPYFESLGLPKEKFDSHPLAAAFAVWAATKEAAFLHGRFVWASWDVKELASGEIRKEIDEDPYFLRLTVAPLREGKRA